MPSGMKGLTSFVSDVRNCATKDAERKRIEKELAKIRVKFSSDQTLSGYDRKKYVWKLLYAFMLGYDVDFGHIQAVNLCSSVKFSEKAAGYLACSLLLSDSPDILRLIINVCKGDLQGKSGDCVTALALHALANVGGPEFAENLFPDVARILSSNTASPYIRKKAALCLLRLHRRDPELLIPSEWAPKLVAVLDANLAQGTKDIGLVTSVVALLVGVLETSTPTSAWSECLRPAILHLSALVTKECPQPYMYYGVAAPWLQVKLLRMVQFFDPADSTQIDPAVLFRTNEIVARIITTAVASLSATGTVVTGKKTQSDSDRLNRSNAENAILFEAINIVIHFGPSVDREVRRNAASLLGSFISSPEANTRYLGLESMSRLAVNAEHQDVLSAASEHKLLDKYKSLIASQLHEPDVSIRRQALNLLYVICDKGNWQLVVDELLQVLSNRDPQLEEELVLIVAVLAEANAPDPTWYVDVVFKMFEYAPESVGEEVYFRAIQVVVGSEADVGLHSASKAYEALGGLASKPTFPHESMLRLCTYLLGEFGHLLVAAKQVTSLRLVELLHKHFARMSPRCKGMCLVAYGKILNANPTNRLLRDEVGMRIEAMKDSSDPDLQQRSCELIFLINSPNPAVLERVLAVIPPLTGGADRRNPLMERLKLQSKQSRVGLPARTAAAAQPQASAPAVAVGGQRNVHEESSSSSDDDDSEESDDSESSGSE